MGSLTVHVIDKRKKPLRGETVFCNSSGFTHLEQRTDREGVAQFEKLPLCPLKLYVRHRLQLELAVGQNDEEDITIAV